MPINPSAAWMKPGAVGTGTITIVAGNVAVTGVGTALSTQLANGDKIYWYDTDGGISSGIIASRPSATSATLTVAPALGTNAAAPIGFVFSALAPAASVVGAGGATYKLTPGASSFGSLSTTFAALLVPGPAVAAATAGNWQASATPPSPAAVTHYLVPRNMVAPNSFLLSVTGQDGCLYKLLPYPNGLGAFILPVPAPAVTPALVGGWTLAS